MHQSLDSDEVLNVRWATEDPNPTAKIAEHKHLVKTGQDGIAKALDPDFVQAVREMDEFEGLVEPRKREAIEAPEAAQEEVDAGGRGKRARIEAPAPPAPAPAAAPAPAPEPTQPAGILSANAIDSLKYLASLNQQGTVKVAPKPAAPTGLGGLADYGSDSDDE